MWPISNSSAQDADFIRHPYGPRWIGRYDFHAGIDINVPIGTEVHAIAAGTVIATNPWNGSTPSAGSNVLVAHADDRFSAYLHLSEIGVSIGDTLAQGMVVGLSGDTGASTPHLHLTCMVGLTGSSNDERKSVNPMAWLPHTERTPMVQQEGDSWIVQLSAPQMRIARVALQGGDVHDASYADIVAQGSTARDDQEQYGVYFSMTTGPDEQGLFDLTLEPLPAEPNLTLQLFDIDGQLVYPVP